MSLGKLNNWEELRLDEVFDISRGGSPRPIKDYITESNEGYNWIKIGDTKKVDKYIYSTKQKIKKDGLKKSVLVQEDDFILSNSMSFGKPYIMKTEGCIHDGWLLMRRKSKDLSIDYMYYLLSSDVIKSQFKNKAAGSTVQNLNIKLVSTVKALIPSYKEQQKIADILSTVDAKIEVIDQQITETQDLKKGLMQRLLTKGIGHTEFKDSALGEIPVSWEVVKLKDKCDKLNVGFVGTCERFYCAKEEGVLMLRTGNLSKGRIKHTNLKYVTKEFHQKNKKSQIFEGDLLVARHGSSGQAVLVPENFQDSNCLNIIIIRPNKEVLNSNFLKFQFNSAVIKEQVRKKTAGSTQGVVNTKEIASLNVLVPPYEEQQKIAAVLCSVDEKLEVLSEKKTTYQELKKGLMQQLLTGKVRVAV